MLSHDTISDLERVCLNMVQLHMYMSKGLQHMHDMCYVPPDEQKVVVSHNLDVQKCERDVSDQKKSI